MFFNYFCGQDKSAFIYSFNPGKLFFKSRVMLTIWSRFTQRVSSNCKQTSFGQIICHTGCPNFGIKNEVHHKSMFSQFYSENVPSSSDLACDFQNVATSLLLNILRIVLLMYLILNPILSGSSDPIYYNREKEIWNVVTSSRSYLHHVFISISITKYSISPNDLTHSYYNLHWS